MNLIWIVLNDLTNVYGFLIHDTASRKRQQKASPFVLALPGQRGPGSRVKWSSLFTKLLSLSYSSFPLILMSSVYVAMEERATQRAERKRKLEEAKQQREEEKLVRKVEN